ncbi:MULTISPECIES: hypothetical protein [unclassified Pedobacter]|uniref:hypothetical protein n=1 Tax=unclassified Pedobacter TaxID=2628915 RepID=UPI001E3A5AE2|nr:MULTISPECIES: hypothetical protein [unclassified Pedobacter]
MKKQLLLSFLTILIGTTASYAQQKLKDGSVSSGNLPSKNAILELESANKGFLHTRIRLVKTSDAAPLTDHVAGMKCPI